MFFDGVKHPHYIPDALSDNCAPHKQSRHSGTLASRTFFGAAAKSEAALLDGKRRKALADCTYRKVAVASVDGFFVAWIFDYSEGDVRAL